MKLSRLSAACRIVRMMSTMCGLSWHSFVIFMVLGIQFSWEKKSIWIHLTFCHATVWLYRSPICYEWGKEICNVDLSPETMKIRFNMDEEATMVRMALVRKIFSGKQKGRVFSFRYVKRWHSERLRPKVIQIRQVHLWELNISNPN